MVRRLRRARTESGLWPSRSSSAKVQGEPRRFLGPTVLTSATNCSPPHLYQLAAWCQPECRQFATSAMAVDVVRYLRSDWFDGAAPGNLAATYWHEAILLHSQLHSRAKPDQWVSCSKDFQKLGLMSQSCPFFGNFSTPKVGYVPLEALNYY
jgi:hypothetical protein